MKKNRRIVMPLLVFILVIGGWELYVRAFDISLYILPSPSKIISALIENFDILMQHSLVTLEEYVLGLLISTFFPIAISFTDALSQVSEKEINLLKSFGANLFQIYKIVKIPSGAIGLFSGLKVAATYCVGGAIVGEWLSSRAGLGYYMLRVKNGYMLDKVFACVLMIIFWSILLNLGVTLLEKLLFPHLRKGERK